MKKKRKMFDENDNFVGNQVYVEEGGSDKRPNRKPLMIILLILVVLLVGVGGFFLGKKLYDNSKEKEASKYDLASVIDKVYEADDGSKYIRGLSDNIGFEVSSKDVKFRLLDSEGNEVEAKIIEVDGKFYVVPVNGFTKGETYSLEILDDSGTFVSDKLATSNKFSFSIANDASNNFTYADGVKPVATSNIVKKTTMKKVNVSGSNAKVGDVVYLKNDDGSTLGSYVINSIDDDGVASVSQYSESGNKVSITTEKMLSNSEFNTINVTGTGVVAGEVLFVTDGDDKIAAYQINSVNGSTATATKITVSDGEKSSANKKSVDVNTFLQYNSALTKDLLKNDDTEIINTTGVSVSAGDVLIITDNGKNVAAYNVKSVSGNTATVVKTDVTSAINSSATKKYLTLDEFLNNNKVSSVSLNGIDNASDGDILSVKDSNGNISKTYKINDVNYGSVATVTEIDANANKTIVSYTSSEYVKKYNKSSFDITGATTIDGTIPTTNNVVVVTDGATVLAAYRIDAISGNTVTRYTTIDDIASLQLSSYNIVNLSVDNFVKNNPLNTMDVSDKVIEKGDYIIVQKTSGTAIAAYYVTSSDKSSNTASLQSKSVKEVTGFDSAAVISVQNSSEEAIRSMNASEIEALTGSAKVGDVITTYDENGQPNGGLVIDSINSDGTVNFVTATLEQILSEASFSSGSDTVDLFKASDGTFDNVNVKLSEALENSGMYQAIVTAANKSGSKVKNCIYIVPITNGFKFVMNINVDAGEGFLGLKGMGNHSILFSLEAQITLNVGYDYEIHLIKESFAEVEARLAESENLTIQINSNYQHDTRKSILNKPETTYDLDGTIAQALASFQEGYNAIMSQNKTSGDENLLEYNIPIEMTPLTVTLQLDFVTSLGLNFNATFNQQFAAHQGAVARASTRTGITFKTDIGTDVNSVDFDLAGYAEARAGLEFKAGISLINKSIANVSLTAGLGIYGKLTVLAAANYDFVAECGAIEGSGSLEFGVYINAGIEANLFKWKIDKNFGQGDIPLFTKTGSFSEQKGECKISSSGSGGGSGDGYSDDESDKNTTSVALGDFKVLIPGDCSVSTTSSGSNVTAQSFNFTRAGITIDASIGNYTSAENVSKNYSDIGYTVSDLSSWSGISSFAIDGTNSANGSISFFKVVSESETYYILNLDIDGSKMITLRLSADDNTTLTDDLVREYLAKVTVNISKNSSE